MAKVSFADRYAEIGLAPGADIVAARAAPAGRILDEITNDQIFAMISTYYELASPNLEWLRAQFIQEDPSFSLVNNAREVRLLCAAMLDDLIQRGNDNALLAIVTASACGKRKPNEFGWLVEKARVALEAKAVEDRAARNVDTRVTTTLVPKLADEINAVADGDWASFKAIITKVRSEAANSAKTSSGQASKALEELERQVRLQREENQMLWWMVGGYSRTLDKPFSKLSLAHATIFSAVDLGGLTTVSNLGPVAAPAMLERMIALVKKPPKTTAKRSLGETIDAISKEELQLCKIDTEDLPDDLAIVATAIELARTLGPGAWNARFKELTKVSADTEFEAVELATLLYREHLLGQLL